MEEEINPKQKLINRIEKENLCYRENFTLSLENRYEYCSTLTFDKKNKAYNNGLFIYGPRFTDYTEIEQAYCMAHELGHHYVYKKMSPILLKIAKYRLPIMVERVECLAWKEAEIICREESIIIDNGFCIIRNNCLNTYKVALNEWFKGILKFIMFTFISYYGILIIFYLIYSCSKDNIIDLFGLVNYFRDIDPISVGFVSNLVWFIYTTYRILKIFTLGIEKIKA